MKENIGNIQESGREDFNVTLHAKISKPDLHEENICLRLNDDDAFDGIGEHVGTGAPTH